MFVPAQTISKFCSEFREQVSWIPKQHKSPHLFFYSGPHAWNINPFRKNESTAPPASLFFGSHSIIRELITPFFINGAGCGKNSWNSILLIILQQFAREQDWNCVHLRHCIIKSRIVSWYLRYQLKSKSSVLISSHFEGNSTRRGQL